MTVRERAAALAGSVTALPADLAGEALLTALRAELNDVADIIESAALHKEKMYGDIGLNGEDEARPYRDIAASIRRRAEL